MDTDEAEDSAAQVDDLDARLQAAEVDLAEASNCAQACEVDLANSCASFRKAIASGGCEADAAGAGNGTGAGSTLEATEAVLLGRARTALALVRPPGHHAERDEAMGFCFYNNVLIGVAHAEAAHGLSRVAILDFDVRRPRRRTTARARRELGPSRRASAAATSTRHPDARVACIAPRRCTTATATPTLPRMSRAVSTPPSAARRPSS